MVVIHCFYHEAFVDYTIVIYDDCFDDIIVIYDYCYCILMNLDDYNLVGSIDSFKSEVVDLDVYILQLIFSWFILHHLTMLI